MKLSSTADPSNHRVVATGQPRVLHIATRHSRELGTAWDINIALGWEVRNGYRVHLVVGDGREPGPLPDTVTNERVNNLTRSIRPIRDIRALRHLRDIIRTFRPDVIQTHQSKAGILGRLAARGSDATVVHNVHMASFGRGYSRSASWIFTIVERLCARVTDHFVTVSDELAAEYLAAGIGRPKQFTVIHTPIDVARFAAARSVGEERRRHIRTRFALPQNVPILLGCGLLERRKRWDLFIKLVAPMLRSGEAVAVIAGIGQEEQALRRLARELGVADQVVLPGYIEDVVDLYAIASVVVLTSATEGLARVLLEGIAAGVPVVATDVQGAKELSSFGLVICPATGVGLAAACRRLIRKQIAPIDVSALDAWTTPAIEQQLATLHSVVMGSRRPSA